MFLWAPFTKIVQIFPIRWKTWQPGGGACFPYLCIVKTLKIFLSKSAGPIWKLFCKKFIGAPFTKIVQIFPICWKTWPPGGRASFPYMGIVNILKIFLSKSTRPILKLFCTNVPLGTLYQDCSNIPDPLKKHGRQGEKLVFLICALFIL